MLLDPEARKDLQQFQFKRLFINHLGWDRFNTAAIILSAGESDYTLHPIAEKGSIAVLHCQPDASGAIPAYPIRRKIEQRVARSYHEHLIIFTDKAETRQIWQWVLREPGRRPVAHEQAYNAGGTGESLLQRLEKLLVAMEEEEALTITDVAGRARGAFNVERVTRRFYDRYKAENDAFKAFIKGLPGEEDQKWYASIMLNRMMFVYFIQKKGFLDGDQDYLRNRLRRVQQQQGKGRFLSFYRHFLLRLFHEGLGKPVAHREADLEALIGRIPYLNGGLFDVHELERDHDHIDIPDEAFDRIFDFFDAYAWHLDERPLHADNEINPDVLGYIFEKYINQKQMGAYYTKEDITGYISRNTILPWVVDTARKEFYRLFPKRLQDWLDQGYGACVLGKPEIKTLVEDAIRHFEGERYRLDEFVVMPNHVHVLVAPMGTHTLSEVLHSWKSFTAHEINKRLGLRGMLWQKESYDHIVRNEASHDRIREYIRANPLVLGLNVNAVNVAAASSGISTSPPLRRDAAATMILPETELPEFVREGMHDPKMRMFNRDYNLTQAVIPGPDGENLALLASALFIAYAEPGGQVAALCADFLARGKVLYHLDIPENAALAAQGSRPVTPESLARVLSPK